MEDKKRKNILVVNGCLDGHFTGSVGIVKELVSLNKNQLSDNKFSDCVCTSLEEFLINIIETNEKLNTIDIILDVSKE